MLAYDKTPVAQATARRLQQMIRAGELRPGDRIPSQRVLSGRLKVSRPSLREALLTLETLGLVRTLPARGTFVVDPADLPVAAAGGWRYGDAFSLSDVFGTRLLIEPELAALAATSVQPAVHAALDGPAEDFATAWRRGDLVAHAEADRAFHGAIAEACPNAMLRGLYRSVQEIVVESQRQPIPATDPGRMEQSIAEHRAILAAIVGRDAPGARKAMRVHIESTARCAGIDL